MELSPRELYTPPPKELPQKDMQHFLDAMEGRFDAIFARHNQLLLEKILESLQANDGRVTGHLSPVRLSKDGRKRPTSSLISDRSVDGSGPSVEIVRPLPSAKSSPKNILPEQLFAASNFKVKATSSQPSKQKSKIPSVVALDVAMLHNLGNIGRPVSASNSASIEAYREEGISSIGSPSPSPESMKKKSEQEVLPPAELPHSTDDLKPEPSRTLMGMPQDPGPLTVTATKIEVLMKDSQSAILAEIDDGSVPDVELDIGSRAMLSIPRCMPMFLGFFSILLAFSILHMSLRFSHIHIQSELLESFTTALFGLLGMASARSIQAALLSPDLELALHRLQLFLTEFHVDWTELLGQLRWRPYALVWLLLCSTQVATQGIQWYLLDSGAADGTNPIFKVLGASAVLSFAMSSAVIMITCFVMSHIILGLDTALDCWCCYILSVANFEHGVVSWNNLQALLKCVGRELDTAFLWVQVLSSLGFMYLLTYCVTWVFRAGQLNVLTTVAEGLAALPLVGLFGLSMRLFSHGAALTEKCKFIPSFVNQIPREEAIDQDKQFLVHFVTNSNAGFFIRNVRLTQEMFVKQFVLVCGLLSGLFGALSRIYI